METLLVALAFQAASILIYIRSHRGLLFSILALRQQLAVYKSKQQFGDATFEDQPGFLIHDNDGIFGQLGKSVTVEVKGNHGGKLTINPLWWD